MSEQKYTFATYGILSGASFFSSQPDECEPFEIGAHYLDPLFNAIGAGKHRLVDEWIHCAGWVDTSEPCRFSLEEASTLAKLLREAESEAAESPEDIDQCAEDLAVYLLSSSDPHVRDE